MPVPPDDQTVRQQLLEDNRRLAQRCLDLESASRRQLEKLRAANAMLGKDDLDLRTLLDSASVGFAFIDRELRIAGANKALSSMLKIPPEELIGANLSPFVYVGSLPAFKHLVTPGSGARGADASSAKREGLVELVARDGDLTPCRIVVNDWLDENRALRGSFLLVFDSGPELQAARRLKETETALAETEKARTLFLETISRELRTPASSVVGMSRMLLDAGLNERQAELAGVIHTSSGSLVRLVDDLVDVASPDPADSRPQPRAVAPDVLIRGVVNLFSVRAEEKGLEIHVHIADNVPAKIMADPRLLRRILTHLVDNSVKFTERGHVAISVDAIGPGIRFMVSDTGPGVDPAGRGSMFQPGHGRDTAVIRRRGGIGVGLSICRRLASILGGRLDFESEPGRGAEFHFSIPNEPVFGEAKSAVIEPPPDAVHLPPLKILLADANPMSSQLVQAYLGFDGHTLTTTENGLDAAEKCRATQYDLVILDRNLPKLDGLQSLRLIREDERVRTGGKRVPVLMLVSRNQMRQSTESLHQAGADGVVGKPIQPLELTTAVAQAAGVEPLSVTPRRVRSDYSAETGGGSLRRMDGAQLANLSQVMPEEQFRGMLRFFMEDAVPGLLSMQERMTSPRPDPERIAFASAKVRGLAGYLGFTALSGLLERVEQACRTNATSDALRELAGELSMTTDDSLEELKRILPAAFTTISHVNRE